MKIEDAQLKRKQGFYLVTDKKMSKVLLLTKKESEAIKYSDQKKCKIWSPLRKESEKIIPKKRRCIFYYNSENYFIDTEGNVFKTIYHGNKQSQYVKFLGKISKPEFHKKYDDYSYGICPIDCIIYENGYLEI